jgi:hypothetical protein
MEGMVDMVGYRAAKNATFVEICSLLTKAQSPIAG